MYRVLVTAVGNIIGYGLARSARRSRYPVCVVGMDMLADAPGRAWTDEFVLAPPAAADEYPQFLYDLVISRRIDLILPGLEPEVHRLDTCRAQLEGCPVPVVLQPSEIIRITSDKWLTYKKLAEAGHPVIATRLAAPYEELAADLGTPFLMKPRTGSASRGIRVIADRQDHEYWTSRAGAGSIFQRIIGNDREEYTVGVFGYGDGTCSHILPMRRTLGPTGATVKAEVVADPGLSSAVERIVSLFKPLGPTNLQLRRDSKEYLLLEVNPRFSSSVSLRTAFGINDVELAIEHYLLGIRPLPRQINPGRAVRYYEDLVTTSGPPSLECA